jgi:hypothetical protein
MDEANRLLLITANLLLLPIPTLPLLLSIPSHYIPIQSPLPLPPTIGIDPSLIPFRDAGFCINIYPITVLDCAKALCKAKNLGNTLTSSHYYYHYYYLHIHYIPPIIRYLYTVPSLSSSFIVIIITTTTIYNHHYHHHHHHHHP